MNALTTQFQNMSGNEDEDSDESDSDEPEQNEKSKKKKSKASGSGTGVYVPPKLTAVHYDGEDTKAERARKQMERARKRALK